VTLGKRRGPWKLRNSNLERVRSARILADIGGSETLRAVATRFYNHCFLDKHLDKFIEDHSDPHGERLGNWFAEKMGGEGPIWSNTRPRNARSMAHARSWYSHKREKEKRGRRFKLDDCRIWMRLMFWSAREEGLAEHKPFWAWFVMFISHFICVYEYTAGEYGQESSEWSANASNVERYEKAGHVMNDVISTRVL